MRQTLSLLIAVAIPCTELPAQLLSVSVRDTSGAPVSDVALALVDTRGEVWVTAKTTESGVAHWPRAESGSFRVHARRFGFRPGQSDLFHLGPADTIAIRLTLDRAPAVLDPVVIAAEKNTVRDSRAFGFNLRATGGHIITPSEIEMASLGARDVADVLARRALPGMIIDQRIRCVRSVRRPGCLPFVIDGQVFRNGASLQDAIIPEIVDYIVVLRGSEVGVRYGSIGQNGMILIATKRGEWSDRR